VLCTGSLGDAAGGLEVLEQGLSGHAELRHSLLRPRPPVEAGMRLGELGLASAMIDLSDGLVQDLGHICERSSVGAALWLDDLPVSEALRALCTQLRRDPLLLAATGGEDFQLLFTAPENKLLGIEEALAGSSAVHVIGEIGIRARPGEPPVRLLRGGVDVTAEPPWSGAAAGFDHFRERPGAL
jgi:thiamine-monophosphate kinase